MAKPRKRPTYKAAPQPEVGRTGLRIWAGRVDEEWHAPLRGDRARKAYQEMADQNIVVGILLNAMGWLIRSVPWRFELPDPEADNNSDERVQFLEECRDDLNHPWTDFLAEATRGTMTFGFSVNEVVFKKRMGWPGSRYSDGRIGWAKFAPRAQETVVRWIQREGSDDVVAFEQQPPPDWRPRLIPLEKCLHLRFEPMKGNPEGRSMLRSAWPAHRDKKHIERMEGIGVERNLAGMHVVYVPPQWLPGGGGTADQQQAGRDMEQIARNIKADEQQGLVLPAMFDENGNRLVEIQLIGGGAAGGGSQRVLDTGAIIQRLDQRILQLCMADFLLLGHEKVGSFALSSDKTALFAVALGVWLDTFAEAFNQQVVPRLLDLNGMEVEGHTRLMHGDLESRNLTEVAD